MLKSFNIALFAIESCRHLRSHNAESLNNAYICVLRGLEDDLTYSMVQSPS